MDRSRNEFRWMGGSLNPIGVFMTRDYPKKPTMFEAAKRVMGIMESITAREIIVRLKEDGRKEVPTPRQIAQKFRSDPEIESIKSENKKEPTVFRRIR